MNTLGVTHRTVDIKFTVNLHAEADIVPSDGNRCTVENLETQAEVDGIKDRWSPRGAMLNFLEACMNDGMLEAGGEDAAAGLVIAAEDDAGGEAPPVLLGPGGDYVRP